jgi:hypothetical protein
MPQTQLNLLPELQAVVERNNLVLPTGDKPLPDRASPLIQSSISLVPKLPSWREHERGTPNTFLRSSLFAAVQGRQRRNLKDEILGSIEGV